MKALLIVDLQNDFLPGGALPAPQGNQIIPVINQLMNQFSLVIASRDWHPKDTVHFNEWPVHCVAETKGADFPERLDQSNIGKIVQKGTTNSDDGYSAFEATKLNLDSYLKENRVSELFICGLTTEYCVKKTVLNALELGYETVVVKNAVAGVQAQAGDEEKAWKEMKNSGAQLITFA
ncbi:isochorismatase family protein [uncultured Sunxiuqinia sp.]|uniref:isochorismatase family protein n=1 Tax=uncultured Sunxiuqinia sp. TaxID=1573825 RepID=UPI002AA8CA3E|nr:isochorismatase family protein [uncultured Sunxiuqinia sp.]